MQKEWMSVSNAAQKWIFRGSCGHITSGIGFWQKQQQQKALVILKWGYWYSRVLEMKVQLAFKYLILG